jgi:hypothetical protein
MRVEPSSHNILSCVWCRKVVILFRYSGVVATHILPTPSKATAFGDWRKADANFQATRLKLRNETKNYSEWDLNVDWIHLVYNLVQSRVLEISWYTGHQISDFRSDCWCSKNDSSTWYQAVLYINLTAHIYGPRQTLLGFGLVPTMNRGILWEVQLQSS